MDKQDNSPQEQPISRAIVRGTLTEGEDLQVGGLRIRYSFGLLSISDWTGRTVLEIRPRDHYNASYSAYVHGLIQAFTRVAVDAVPENDGAPPVGPELPPVVSLGQGDYARHWPESPGVASPGLPDDQAAGLRVLAAQGKCHAADSAL